ncbi:hypothetical protein IAQ61_007339 [Plenodomus lingam]|uniref:uncharacterized protein n=1 Tax=Leptosphaeria maculans TaxID=5022 RepID=UPI003331EDFC|nr:hypothetical protein IAQ61_007339 [Plenodomus lingam]
MPTQTSRFRGQPWASSFHLGNRKHNPNFTWCIAQAATAITFVHVDDGMSDWMGGPAMRNALHTVGVVRKTCDALYLASRYKVPNVGYENEHAQVHLFMQPEESMA